VIIKGIEADGIKPASFGCHHFDVSTITSASEFGKETSRPRFIVNEFVCVEKGN
jgi:hypothetical protein